MTALKILAILGVVLGAVFLVVDFKKRGRQSMGVFIALIIASAALLAVSCLTHDRFIQRDQLKAQQQNQVDVQDNSNLEDIDPVIGLDLSDVDAELFIDDQTQTPEDTEPAADEDNPANTDDAQVDENAENTETAADEDNPENTDDAQVDENAENTVTE